MRMEEIPSFLISNGKKEGATDIAVKFEENDETMIRFSNNEITVTKNWREKEVEIFVIAEKGRAETRTGILSTQNLRELIKRLVNTARTSPPAEVYAPLPTGPFEYDYSRLEPSKGAVPPERLIGYVKKAIDSAREAGAEKVAGSLTFSIYKISVQTSGGVYAKEQGTNLEVSVRAFSSELASGHSVSIAREEEGFDPALAGRQAGEIADKALNPMEGQPGRYDVLLGPLVFADLISQLGERASAFLIDAGQSFLADKIGSQIASKELTLHDDPILKGSYGLRIFDDEGVPTRRNTIVEKGKLKTYLHNSTTAKKSGVETTGNAGLLVPTPWNLVIEPGNKKIEDILSTIDRGIYITNSWYLRYQDYSKGDFSTIPRDGMFLIRNGELTNPVRNLRISDNILRIFRNTARISRERQWIKWWEVETPTLTPHALVTDLNLSKSTI
ncbi:MAG: TldD/PmbA family protein [Candidatus Bathyarchaeota archaeon]|nr:MAG: TldD/PmbA family protein [Candidatus Bathyarchaeota archaeon]